MDWADWPWRSSTMTGRVEVGGAKEEDLEEKALMRWDEADEPIAWDRALTNEGINLGKSWAPGLNIVGVLKVWIRIQVLIVRSELMNRWTCGTILFNTFSILPSRSTIRRSMEVKRDNERGRGYRYKHPHQHLTARMKQICDRERCHRPFHIPCIPKSQVVFLQCYL